MAADSMVGTGAGTGRVCGFVLWTVLSPSGFAAEGMSRQPHVALQGDVGLWGLWAGLAQSPCADGDGGEAAGSWAGGTSVLCRESSQQC